MKVKVLKNFIDKETKTYNRVGTSKKPTIIEVSDERAKEILAAGNYIEPYEAQEESVVEEDGASEQVEGTGKTTNDILDDVLNGMTVVELKEHADKHEVELNGARTKAAIVEAIKDTGADDSASEGNDDSADAQSEPEQNKKLEEMSLAELKEYASEHGITLNGARTKAAIIETIKTAEK